MKTDEIINKWNHDNAYSEDSLFVDTLRQKGISDTDIVIVLGVIDNICHHCWDEPSGCQCWNDD